MRPLILVTNDDGYRAEGLSALVGEIRGLGEIYVVAPEEERSAVSHAITLRDPLRVKRISEKVFAVHGTPADCVILALRVLLPRKPDLVISGINHGRNLGDDVMYSGTVAGAREACYLDLQSFAISAVREGDPLSFGQAACFAEKLAAHILADGLPAGSFLNVNVPSVRKVRGMRWTHQGSRVSRAELLEGCDPRGNLFYWIGEDDPAETPQEEAGSDYEAISKGYISVTPLHRDQTDYAAIRNLEDRSVSFSSLLPEKKGRSTVKAKG